MNRREMLKAGASLGALAIGGKWITACTVPGPGPGSTTTTAPPTPGYGALNAADANGVKLPNGFTSRIVAVSGQQVGSTGYTWHPNPDGGACYPTGDGGWIYVSNSETGSPGGGVSMIRFDAAGDIVQSQSILSATGNNCAGGKTPWGTWLSCEELSRGRVFECDPTGVAAPIDRPALGWFAHEAVAVETTTNMLFLTEDKPDGGLYRFTPSGDSLAAGTLEILTDVSGTLSWVALPNPNPTPAETSTRYQVPNTRTFNGGEGITAFGGAVYFTTKGDNRVWKYSPSTNVLAIVYDVATSATPVLSGVDNVTNSGTGDLYVAEDGGDMQIVQIMGDTATAVLQVEIAGSEITGPAFNPAGNRLYFSSQRNPGTTFEVTGPWRQS